MKLRPYQSRSLDLIKSIYSTGKKRVLLHLATGGGKTLIFCQIMKSAAQKGKKCVMIVRGRELVDQGSRRLSREGVDHGVMMAAHWKQDFNNPIQVCSVDTLRARNIIPDADLVVIDEAHLSGGKTYKWILDEYAKKGAFILGVTATPHCKEGLSHIADEIVYPISIGELIEQGYLVKPEYFAPIDPDLSKVKIRGGDYDEKQLSETMGLLVGDVVTNWIKIAQNRPTICFAVDVIHSKKIKASFEAAGVACEHIDANTPDKERKEALKRLEDGKIKVITNCGVLCTGVDMPFVSCILMARPTKSYNLYIQQAGRGTRLYNNKDDFFILDHAGNIKRHGFIENERIATIEPVSKKKNQVDIPSVASCGVCFAVFSAKLNQCPRCGDSAQIKKPRKLMQIDGELAKISAQSIFEIEVRSFINQMKNTAKARGYKRGWIFHRVKDKYGEDVAKKFIPKRVVPEWVRQRRAT